MNKWPIFGVLKQSMATISHSDGDTKKLKERKRFSIKKKLAKLYPFEKPKYAEQGGWNGLFTDLELLIGVAFHPQIENS